MAFKSKLYIFCIYCPVFLLTLVYIIIYYSHYATCHLDSHLCKPWDDWIKRLRNPPNAMTDMEFNQTLHAMWNQNITNACSMTTFHHICPNEIKLGIVFAQRHGGSTWMMTELEKYRQINIKREMLLGWEHSECSQYSQMFESKRCDAVSLIHALDDIYSNKLQKNWNKTCHTVKRRMKKNGGHFGHYFFWKIQISQIPPYLFLTLINYIYCHKIMVLHLIREAAVASFWSYQAQTVERVSSGNADKLMMKEAMDKDERVRFLHLDPYMTARYVKNIETNRKMFGLLIELYPKCIKYQRYYYEDLIGPYSERYWSSILSWIGGPKLKHNKINERSEQFTREHPMPCFTKISNWKDVRAALEGTDSYSDTMHVKNTIPDNRNQSKNAMINSGDCINRVMRNVLKSLLSRTRQPWQDEFLTGKTITREREMIK